MGQRIDADGVRHRLRIRRRVIVWQQHRSDSQRLEVNHGNRIIETVCDGSDVIPERADRSCDLIVNRNACRGMAHANGRTGHRRIRREVDDADCIVARVRDHRYVQ